MKTKRHTRRKQAGEHERFRRREDGVERGEVHVAGICVRKSGLGWEVLVAKRDSSREFFPDKWECGGGQVRRGESFSAAVKRQFFEEFQLDVQVHHPIVDYEIQATKQGIIPGMRFLCEVKEGEVRLNLREFSESRWLKLPVTEELDWIGGIKKALDIVASDITLAGVLRRQVDLEATTLSELVQESIATCLQRCRDGDLDGAISAACGAVDKLTEQIYEARSLGNALAEQPQRRITTAFKALEPEYMSSLVSLEPEIASLMYRNHQQAINHAAHVLSALRRENSDAHGTQAAGPVLVQRAIDCAIFILRSLGSLFRG